MQKKLYKLDINLFIKPRTFIWA